MDEEKRLATRLTDAAGHLLFSCCLATRSVPLRTVAGATRGAAYSRATPLVLAGESRRRLPSRLGTFRPGNNYLDDQRLAPDNEVLLTLALP
jgi:hypothetical protein